MISQIPESIAIFLAVVLCAFFIWLCILSIKIHIAYTTLNAVLEQEKNLHKSNKEVSLELQHIMKDLYFIRNSSREKHSLTATTVEELIKTIQLLATTIPVQKLKDESHLDN